MHEITGGFQAKRITDNWIGFHNAQRPHAALDKRPLDIACFGNAETRKMAGTHTRCILDKPQTCPKKQNHFKDRTVVAKDLKRIHQANDDVETEKALADFEAD